MMYLYAISHRNLPVHQQAIQGAHAQLEYVRHYGTPEEHPTFIWLTVANKMDLLLLGTMLEFRGIQVCEFHDPDFDGYDPSAIACMLTEEQRSLLSDLSLWRCSPTSAEPYKGAGYNQFEALENANKSQRPPLSSKLRVIDQKIGKSMQRIRALMSRNSSGK